MNANRLLRVAILKSLNDVAPRLLREETLHMGIVLLLDRRPTPSELRAELEHLESLEAITSTRSDLDEELMYRITPSGRTLLHTGA